MKCALITIYIYTDKIISSFRFMPGCSSTNIVITFDIIYEAQNSSDVLTHVLAPINVIVSTLFLILNAQCSQGILLQIYRIRPPSIGLLLTVSHTPSLLFCSLRIIIAANVLIYLLIVSVPLNILLLQIEEMNNQIYTPY